MINLIPILFLAASYSPYDAYNRYCELAVTSDWRIIGNAISSESDKTIRLEDFTYALAMSGERRFLLKPFSTFEPYYVSSNYFGSTVSTGGHPSYLDTDIMEFAIDSAKNNLLGDVNPNRESWCFLEGSFSEPSFGLAKSVSDDYSFVDVCSDFGMTPVTNADALIEMSTNRLFRFPYLASDVITVLSNSATSYSFSASETERITMSNCNFTSGFDINENWATNFYPSFSYGNHTTNSTTESTIVFEDGFMRDVFYMRSEYSRSKDIIRVWDWDDESDEYSSRDSSVTTTTRFSSMYSSSYPELRAWVSGTTNVDVNTSIQNVYCMLLGTATEKKTRYYYKADDVTVLGPSHIISDITEEYRTNTFRFACVVPFSKNIVDNGRYIRLVSLDSMTTIGQTVFSDILGYDVNNELKPTNLGELEDPAAFSLEEGVNTAAIRSESITLTLTPERMVFLIQLFPKLVY